MTFVAGRSRAQIADQMESMLGLQRGGTDGQTRGEEGVEELKVTTAKVGGSQWTTELERGIADVWRIARQRLSGLGVP